MTAADLVVTKPGGLSVSECLAKTPAHAAGFAHSRTGRAQCRLSTRVRRRHQSRGWRDARIQARTPDGRAARVFAAMSAAAARIGRPRRGSRRGCANIRRPHEIHRNMLCLTAVLAAPVLAQDAPAPVPAAAAARPAHWAEPIDTRGRAESASHLPHALSQRAAHARSA